MLALIKLPATFLAPVAEGGWLEVPGTTIRVSPAETGWTDGTHALVPFVPAEPPPPGKHRVGEVIHLVMGGTCTEVYELADDPPPSPAELMAHLADIRWQRETGGAIWVKDDAELPISTDDRSQQKVMAELQAVALGLRQDGSPWKFADGTFRPLPNADVLALALAARDHVVKTFAAEGAVQILIASSAVHSLDDVGAAFEAAMTTA